MKNEVMAKAITGIDEDLLLAVPSRKRQHRAYWGLAAACFLLFTVTAVALLFHRGAQDGLYVDNQPLGRSPVVIDAPVPLAGEVRQPAAITVTVEIRKAETVSVEAVQGTTEIYSMETNERIAAGSSYEGEGPLRIGWRIEKPTPGREYTLRINESVQLSLSYYETEGQWILTKK